MEFRQLPHEFKRHGVIYRLIRRAGPWVILSLQYRPSGPIVGYDLAKVRVTAFPPKKGIPAGNEGRMECLPDSGAWGQTGWSFDRLETAEKRLADIQNEGAFIQEMPKESPIRANFHKPITI